MSGQTQNNNTPDPTSATPPVAGTPVHAHAGGAGAAPGAAADASAVYSTFIQGKRAVDGTKTTIKDAQEGNTAGVLVDGSSVAVNGLSAGIGVTQLVAGNAEKITQFVESAHLSPGLTQTLTDNLPKLSKFAEDVDLGRIGGVVSYAADGLTVGKAFYTGKDKEAAEQKAFDTAAHIVVTRAVVATVGIGATGFITAGENAGDNYDTRAQAQAAMDKIKPDTHNQSNLRGMIAELRQETVVDPATKKPVPAHPELQDLAADAKGQVDLQDAGNQKKIKTVLQAQDKALNAKVDANSDQFVMPVAVVGNLHIHGLDGLHTGTDLLSDAGRDPVAFRTAAAAEVTRKRVEVSMAELDGVADGAKFAPLASRTAAQQHDDIELARRGGHAPPEEQVTVTTSRITGRMNMDDRKQPLPEDMLKAYAADPNHNLTWEVPLYKKDDHGKPVLDKKGDPVVGKVMHYNIVVEGGEKARPTSTVAGMTTAEEKSAFGSTWQAEWRYDADHKADDLHQKFLKDAKAFSQKDPKASQDNLMASYQSYIDQLKYMKTNAKAFGYDVKDRETAMNNAGRELNAVFDPLVKQAQAENKGATVVRAAPPPKRSTGGAAPA